MPQYTEDQLEEATRQIKELGFTKEEARQRALLVLTTGGDVIEANDTETEEV